MAWIPGAPNDLDLGNGEVISFPSGYTKEAALEYLRTERPELFEKPSGFFPAASATIERMKGSLAAAPLTTLGSFGDQEALEEAGKIYGKAEEEAAGVHPEPVQYTDVIEDYEEEGLAKAARTAWTFAREQVGVSTPYMAPAFVAGKLGGSDLVAKSTLGQKIGAGLGRFVPALARGAVAAPHPLVKLGLGAAAGIGTLALQFFADNLQRQYEVASEGGESDVKPDDINAFAAAAAAGPQAGMDYIFIALMGGLGRGAQNAASMSLKQSLAATTTQAGKATLARTVGRGAVESLTEFPTELAQTVLERAQAGLPISLDDAQFVEEMKATVAGTIPVVGAFGTVGTYRAHRASKKAEENWEKMSDEERRLRVRYDAEREQSKQKELERAERIEAENTARWEAANEEARRNNDTVRQASLNAASQTPVTVEDVIEAADSRNILTNTEGFRAFVLRNTGGRTPNIKKANNQERRRMRSILSGLKIQEYVEEDGGAELPVFTRKQFNDVVKGTRRAKSITPNLVREILNLGTTRTDRSIASNIIKAMESRGYAKRRKQKDGKRPLKPRKTGYTEPEYEEILSIAHENGRVTQADVERVTKNYGSVPFREFISDMRVRGDLPKTDKVKGVFTPVTYQDIQESDDGRTLSVGNYDVTVDETEGYFVRGPNGEIIDGSVNRKDAVNAAKILKHRSRTYSVKQDGKTVKTLKNSSHANEVASVLKEKSPDSRIEVTANAPLDFTVDKNKSKGFSTIERVSEDGVRKAVLEYGFSPDFNSAQILRDSRIKEITPGLSDWDVRSAAERERMSQRLKAFLVAHGARLDPATREEFTTIDETPRYDRKIEAEDTARSRVVLEELEKALLEAGVSPEIVAKVVSEDARMEGVLDPDASGLRALAINMNTPLIRNAKSEAELRAAVRDIVNHEVIHAMRELDLFTVNEWRALVNATARVKNDDGVSFADWAQKVYAKEGYTPSMIEEEAVAEMHRQYFSKPNVKRQIAGQPRTLLERIQKFLEKMVNYMQGVGFDDASAVFGGMGTIRSRDKGEVRTLKDTELEQEMKARRGNTRRIDEDLRGREEGAVPSEEVGSTPIVRHSITSRMMLDEFEERERESDENFMEKYREEANRRSVAGTNTSILTVPGDMIPSRMTARASINIDSPFDDFLLKPDELEDLLGLEVPKEAKELQEAVNKTLSYVYKGGFIKRIPIKYLRSEGARSVDILPEEMEKSEALFSPTGHVTASWRDGTPIGANRVVFDPAGDASDRYGERDSNISSVLNKRLARYLGIEDGIFPEYVVVLSTQPDLSEDGYVQFVDLRTWPEIRLAGPDQPFAEDVVSQFEKIKSIKTGLKEFDVIERNLETFVNGLDPRFLKPELGGHKYEQEVLVPLPAGTILALSDLGSYHRNKNKLNKETIALTDLRYVPHQINSFKAGSSERERLLLRSTDNSIEGLRSTLGFDSRIRPIEYGHVAANQYPLLPYSRDASNSGVISKIANSLRFNSYLTDESVPVPVKEELRSLGLPIETMDALSRGSGAIYSIYDDGKASGFSFFNELRKSDILFAPFFTLPTKRAVASLFNESFERTSVENTFPVYRGSTVSRFVFDISSRDEAQSVAEASHTGTDYSDDIRYEIIKKEAKLDQLKSVADALEKEKEKILELNKKEKYDRVLQGVNNDIVNILSDIDKLKKEGSRPERDKQDGDLYSRALDWAKERAVGRSISIDGVGETTARPNIASRFGDGLQFYFLPGDTKIQIPRDDYGFRREMGSFISGTYTVDKFLPYKNASELVDSSINYLSDITEVVTKFRASRGAKWTEVENGLVPDFGEQPSTLMGSWKDNLTGSWKDIHRAWIAQAYNRNDGSEPELSTNREDLGDATHENSVNSLFGLILLRGSNQIREDFRNKDKHEFNKAINNFIQEDTYDPRLGLGNLTTVSAYGDYKFYAGRRAAPGSHVPIKNFLDEEIEWNRESHAERVKQLYRISLEGFINYDSDLLPSLSIRKALDSISREYTGEEFSSLDKFLDNLPDQMLAHGHISYIANEAVHFLESKEGQATQDEGAKTASSFKKVRLDNEVIAGAFVRLKQDNNKVRGFGGEYVDNVNAGKERSPVVGWNRPAKWSLIDIDSGDFSLAGGQAGSNDGGLYTQDSTGQQFYVKTPKDPDIARNEILASKLYQLAGVEVADANPAKRNGEFSVASTFIPGLSIDESSLSSRRVPGVQENFAVDAWLGNWDVVGLTFDNLLMKEGRGVRIDPGGTMPYRAQGGLKNDMREGLWGPVASDIDSMRDPGIAFEASQVFDKVTDEDLAIGVSKVLSIPTETLRETVKNFGPIDEAQNQELFEILEARRRDLAERVPDRPAVPQPELGAEETEALGMRPRSSLSDLEWEGKGTDRQETSNVDAFSYEEALDKVSESTNARGRERDINIVNAIKNFRPSSGFNTEDVIPKEWGKIEDISRPSYGVVVRDGNGNIVLREVANFFDGYHWSIAKGRMDPGETPLQTALRELKEETGISEDTVPGFKIIGALPGPYASGYSETYLYLAEIDPVTSGPQARFALTDKAVFDEDKGLWSDFDFEYAEQTNSEYLRELINKHVPTIEEMKKDKKDGGLRGNKGLKAGVIGSYEDGKIVDLRIDIPFYTDTLDRYGDGKYAVTVHEPKGRSAGSMGTPISYEPIAKLKGPVEFGVREGQAAALLQGETRSKTTLATVRGAIDLSDQGSSVRASIPRDIDSWTPVGMNPHRAVYFYDKTNGREVVGGTDAISIGNTVFTKEPKYGSRVIGRSLRSRLSIKEDKELDNYNPDLRKSEEPLPKKVKAWHGGSRQLGDPWKPRDSYGKGTGEGWVGGGPLGMGAYFSTMRDTAKKFLKYGGDSPQLSEVVIDTSNMVNIFSDSPKWKKFREGIEKNIEAGLGRGYKSKHLSQHDLFKAFPPDIAYKILDDAGITGFYEKLPAPGGDEIVVFDASVISDRARSSLVDTDESQADTILEEVAPEESVDLESAFTPAGNRILATPGFIPRVTTGDPITADPVIMDEISRPIANGTLKPTRLSLAHENQTELDVDSARERGNRPYHILQAAVSPPLVHKTLWESIQDVLSDRPLAWFRQKAIDKYEGIRRVTEEARRMRGSDLMTLAGVDALKAAYLSDKAKGVVQEGIMSGEIVYRDGITMVDTTKKGLMEIFLPLIPESGPDLIRDWHMWKIAKREGRFEKEGRLVQMTDAERQTIFDEVSNQGWTSLFESVNQDYNSWNNAIVDYTVATGIHTPEMGEIFKKYGDYIPFFREFEGEADERLVKALEDLIGSEFDQMQQDGRMPIMSSAEISRMPSSMFGSLTGAKPFRKAKGGTSMVVDPLTGIMRNLEAAVTSGMKNVAATRVMDDAALIGMATEIDEKDKRSDTHVVRMNGENRYFYVRDPLLHDSLVGMGEGRIKYLNFFSAPAHFLREMVMRSPDFIMANLTRDSVSTWTTAGGTRPMIDTMQNFFGGKTEAFEALKSAGIISGYDNSRTSKDIAKQFSKKLREQGQTPGKKIPFWSSAVKLWEWSGDVSTKSDAATRTAVYESVLEKLLSDGVPRGAAQAEAIYQAAEVINFSRRGNSALAKIITAVIPFMNARIQGLDLLYRAGTGKYSTKISKEDRSRALIGFLSRASLLATVSLMYAGMVEDEEEYKRATPQERDDNWIIPGFGSLPGLKIPTPFEIGFIFKTIPERLYHYFSGDQTYKQTVDAISRGVVTTLEFNVLGPQITKPMMEAMMNHSFYTGSSIVPWYLVDGPAEEQVRPGTNALATAIAGTFNTSPMKTEHVLRGYTGTIGGYILTVTDWAMRNLPNLPARPTLRADQMMVARRFLQGKEGAEGYMSEWYEFRNATRGILSAFNRAKQDGDIEKAEKIFEENSGLIAVKPVISKIDNELSKLRLAERYILLDTKMDKDEKARRVEEINQIRVNILSSADEIRKHADLDPKFPFPFSVFN